MKLKRPIALLGCVAAVLMSTQLMVLDAKAADPPNLVPDQKLAQCIGTYLKGIPVTPTFLQSDGTVTGVSQVDFDALANDEWFTGFNCSDVASLQGLDHLKFGAYIQKGVFGNLQISGTVSDLTPISGLTSLGYLYLDDNSISNISPLSGLTNLRFLTLSRNNVSNLSALSGLTSLEWLNLSSNGISGIQPLANLSALRVLDLSFNNISDVSPLAKLTNLSELVIVDNNISDISSLAPLSSPQNGLGISLGGNHIIDLSPLKPCNNAQITSGTTDSCVGLDAGLQTVNMSAQVGVPIPVPLVIGLDDVKLSMTVIPTSATVNNSTITFQAAGSYALNFSEDNLTILTQYRPVTLTAPPQGGMGLNSGINISNYFCVDIIVTVSGSGLNPATSPTSPVNPSFAGGGGSNNGYQNPTTNNTSSATGVSSSNSTSITTGTQSSVTGGLARAADGSDAYQLQVTLRNSRGQGLAELGSHLSLISTPAGVTLAGVTDNGNGSYTVNATSAVPGIYQVAVQCDGVSVGGLITINFIGGSVGELTVAPGTSQTLIGAGFMPGEQVTVTVHSDPITVATLTADSSGLVKATWSVPAGFIIGAHVATWSSVRSGHVSTPFRVGHKGVSVATGGTVASPLSSRSAAMVLLIAGLVAGILVVRRRSGAAVL